MKNGFTMVEMLVSITILAMGLLSLGVLFPMGIRTTILTKQNTQAMEYAQQKIEFLRMLDYSDADLSNGSHGPELYSMDNSDDIFSLTYTIQDDVPVTDMKRVIVSVQWTKQGGGTMTRQIKTYISRY